MPRATGVSTHLARYEEAWEAINRLIRSGGSWSGHERNCFFVQGRGGRFENASAVSGLDVPEDGRGLAVWDFDRDGDLDMVLKSRNAPQVRIWRNDFARPGNRIQVQLRGVASNRQSVGARVTVEEGGRVRVKEVCAGNGFLSQSTSLLHFGLGEARVIDRVKVRWPTGKTQTFSGVPVNRRYLIVEGSEKLTATEFEPPSPRPQRAARLEPGAENAARGVAGPDAATTAFWLIDPCPLPALELTPLGGWPWTLESMRGKVFVLSFWSPDCPQCLAELEGWGRLRATSRGAWGPLLMTITLSPAARRAEIARIAERLKVPAAIASEASGLSVGVLLEEIGHWAREIPVPASLLIDESGRIVKMYRGPVAWQQLQADSASIPVTHEARLAAALPFPGKYYSTDLHRNDFQLGVSYLEANLEAQALAAFERSLARRPDQPDALYNSGVVHQRRGEAEKAFQCFSDAIDRQPDFADAHVNLGVLLAKSGQLDRAEEEFQQVLELRADHAEAWINLGNVKLSRGRPEEALRAYARAMELEPDIPQIQKKAGDAYRRMGDAEHALKAYEKAVMLAPRDPEAWSNLGVLEAESGRLEEALKTCLKAIDFDPNYASAHNNAGLVLQGLGRTADAILRFRRAIELSPDLPAPYLNLARAHLREGDDVKAIAVLQALLELHPEQPAALEMLRRLRKK